MTEVMTSEGRCCKNTLCKALCNNEKIPYAANQN